MNGDLNELGSIFLIQLGWLGLTYLQLFENAIREPGSVLLSSAFLARWLSLTYSTLASEWLLQLQPSLLR